MTRTAEKRPAARPTLGLNTCFTATRWPDPDDKFRIARDLGVEAVQYSLDAFDPGLPAAYRTRLAARVRRASERTGVAVHSTFTGAGHHHDNLLLHPDAAWRENAGRWFAEALRFTAAVGGRGGGGFLGALPVADAASPAVFAKRRTGFVAALVRLGEEAERLGLSFLLAEPMSVRREPPSTIAEALALVADVNRRSPVPLRLNLDVGHHRAVSAPTADDRDPYAWLRRCGPATEAVHLHQTDGQASRHWPFTPDRNPSGVIEGRKVLRALAEAGAERVLLLIEVFFAPYEPADDRVLEDLAASARYWRAALRAAALTPGAPPRYHDAPHAAARPPRRGR